MVCFARSNIAEQTFKVRIEVVGQISQAWLGIFCILVRRCEFNEKRWFTASDLLEQYPQVSRVYCM